MKRSMLFAVVAVSAIALVLQAIPASAVEGRAFKATMDWTPVSGEWAHQWLTGTGNAIHLGPCTGEAEAWLWWDDEAGVYRSHVTNTLTNASGDQVSLEINEVYRRDKGRWEGTYTITGGAGEFEGASGSGTDVTKSTPATEVHNELEGTIVY
jgi:hypothetical protein